VFRQLYTLWFSCSKFKPAACSLREIAKPQSSCEA